MTDVKPTKTELHVARQGVYFQLKNNTRILDSYPSLAEAIDKLGLGNFIENQVKVIASSRAWSRHNEQRLNNILKQHYPKSEERLNNGG